MKVGQTGLVAALLLGFGLFLWSLSVRAEQPAKVPRVGMLSDETGSSTERHESFAQGLRDLGCAHTSPFRPLQPDRLLII